MTSTYDCAGCCYDSSRRSSEFAVKPWRMNCLEVPIIVVMRCGVKERILASSRRYEKQGMERERRLPVDHLRCPGFWAICSYDPISTGRDMPHEPLKSSRTVSNWLSDVALAGVPVNGWCRFALWGWQVRKVTPAGFHAFSILSIMILFPIHKR